MAQNSWIFDLDNTLYPAECRLFDQVDVKMGRFIAELLQVDRIEARRIQKQYFMSHGTTLRGLMDNHGVEPQRFLDYVHDIDLSPVKPNQRLGDALDALPGRKYVFTNSTAQHSERVLDRLGILAVMDGIFDIASAGYVPKPRQTTYDRLVAQFSIDAGRAVMVEDMARNLKPASEMGMTTVWLDAGHEWGRADYHKDYIDHEIENLTEWLEQRARPQPDLDAGD